MKVSVVGLGHIGSVSAACFAEMGHDVLGLDIKSRKVELLNAGRSPVLEHNLDPIIKRNVDGGRLRATCSPREVLEHGEVIFVCVDTPSKADGSVDVSDIERVSQDLGDELANKATFTVIVLRSTLFPGLVEEIAIPLLESRSGKRVGVDFGFVLNPEFLREGTAVDDFFNPPRTIIAASDVRSQKMMDTLYSGIQAPLFHLEMKEASMLKYADNAFHAMKVAFANEIGRLSKSLSIDSRRVMDVFIDDKKLNLSPYYLKPGFAFGGSCLPKDLRAISHQAQTHAISVPLIKSILQSNDDHVTHTLRRVEQFRDKHIGVLGLSFKGGTDDLRESPIVQLIRKLLQDGVEVWIYDEYVNMAKFIGSTQEYLKKQLPDIAGRLCHSREEWLSRSEVIVIAHWTPEHHLMKEELDRYYLIDLVGITDQSLQQANEERYEGICW